MNIYNIFVCIFLSLYMIDFVGACIHYYLDKYSGNNKYIKPIAIEFQKHHDEPFQLINCSNFNLIHQISTLWFLPFLSFVFHLYLKYINVTSNIIQSIIIIEIVMFSLGSLSQITHKLAHKMNYLSKKEQNTIFYSFIYFLQKYNIILTSKNHKIHHIKFDKNYSVFNGWSTTVFNKIIKQ